MGSLHGGHGCMHFYLSQPYKLTRILYEITSLLSNIDTIVGCLSFEFLSNEPFIVRIVPSTKLLVLIVLCDVPELWIICSLLECTSGVI